MSKRATLLQTSFSQGEVSDEIEARVDVGKRFNGVRVMENWWAMPEGGAFRRPGLQYICEVKDSSKFTMGIPFEYSATDTFAIEAGQGYFRFIKNRAQVVSGGSPVEVTTSPYQESDLRDIHYVQSSDFIFFCNPNPAYDIQKLARISDTSWVLSNFNATPPPSYDADENLAAGYPSPINAALSGNTGTAVKLRIDSDQFLAGDVGRQIISGAGRAVITSIVGTGDGPRQVTADVLDNFAQTITAMPNTLTSVGTTVTSVAHGMSVGNAVLLTSGAQSGEIRIVMTMPTADTFTIDAAFSVDQAAAVTWNKISGLASGAWFLRLAPQVTMDVNKKEPIGAQVSLLAGAASLRSSYVGKFIKMLGGTIKITAITATTTGTGTIMSALSDATTADPAAVAAGAWRLQEASWSATRGRPRTATIHQGRLVFAGTLTQPTTFWAPSLNDIYNFATGALATDAYEYTIKGASNNLIEWLVSLVALYIGDSKQEYSAKGQGVDAPLGGDEVPFVPKISSAGSLHVQPAVVDNAILMTQHFKRDIVQLAYSLQDSPDANSFVPSEPTLFARQISNMMFAKHSAAYQQKPNSIIFYLLENGQLAGLTFKPRQEILAWSRTVTQGVIESVVVVNHENGQGVVTYLIVRRTIDGQTKRFWEYFEDNSSTISSRGWSDLHTDCAKVGTLLAGATTITGITHLPNTLVDVIIGDTYIGQKTVSAAGVITLDAAAGEVPEADTVFEVGLHYNATLTTLRPSIPNEVTEGFKRYWSNVFIRLKNAIGGKLNGQRLKPTQAGRPFTGLAQLENVRTADDYDGVLTLLQDQPYPIICLGLSGKVSFADEPG